MSIIKMILAEYWCATRMVIYRLRGDGKMKIIDEEEYYDFCSDEVKKGKHPAIKKFIESGDCPGRE